MDEKQRAEAAQLYARQLLGETLLNTEKETVEHWQEFEFRLYSQSISKSLFADIAKSNVSTLLNYGTRFGIPIGRSVKTINLHDVTQWIIEFLKANGKAITSGKLDQKADKDDRASRREELELQKVQLHVQTMQAKLQSITENAIPISQVDELFKWWQSELRKLGERLGKRFGSDAQTLFNGSLDRIARHMEGDK